MGGHRFNISPGLLDITDGGAIRAALHDAILNLRLLAQEVPQDEAAQHEQQHEHQRQQRFGACRGIVVLGV